MFPHASLSNSALPTRRRLLQLATAAGLSFVVPGLDARAASRRGAERPKSLITLWLGGGASQLETWDPHPGTRIGGPTRAIPTTIPGVSIADAFPQVAEQLNHLSVIRSLVSREGDHDRATYVVKTGYRPDPTVVHPSMGAIVAHALPNSELEIPSVFSLGYTNHPSRGGFLGGQYNAMRVYDPGSPRQDYGALLADDRRQQRFRNLDVLAKAFRTDRAAVVDRTLHDANIETAVRMMTSDQLKALEITDEPELLRAAYGDSDFGRGCLVARRLVEQGVRAVEVTLQNFDSHAENFTTHRRLSAMLDPALATLLNDLAERDLLQSTVVLCLGEFGRTPRINGADGRDRWPQGFSCLVGGGGLRQGLQIGATDPTGENEDPTDPIPVADLYATVLTVLGIDPGYEFPTSIGRPIRYSDGNPVARLLPS